MRDALAFLREHLEVVVPVWVEPALARAAVPLQARLEYRVKQTRRSYARQALFHWCQYRRLVPQHGLAGSLTGFPRYLRHRWHLPSLISLVSFVATKGRRRSR